MVIFNSYVSLPEGKAILFAIQNLGTSSMNILSAAQERPPKTCHKFGPVRRSAWECDTIID
jgi:hypothetical protein